MDSYSEINLSIEHGVLRSHEKSDMDASERHIQTTLSCLQRSARPFSEYLMSDLGSPALSLRYLLV